MIAIGLAGVLMVVLCGVFVHGLDAIKKGRFRSTALNIADKKIVQFNGLMKSVYDNGQIKGNELRAIITDGDTGVKSIKISGADVLDENTYIVWPDGAASSPVIPIEVEGSVSIKGTANYKYKLTATDYKYPVEKWIKQVRVEVKWEEERVGSKNVFLESLVSLKKDWPTP